MLKGVVFDVNGTMIDDAVYHQISWRRYLESLHLRTMSDEDFKLHVYGKQNADILSYCLGHEVDHDTMVKMSDEKEAVYRECCREDPEGYHLIAGLPEALDILKDHHIPLNMATGSVIGNLDFYFEVLKVGKWFRKDLIVYEDYVTPAKPDPVFYQTAMKNIHLAPSECIVVEDSRTGITGAVNAGAGKIIAITTSSNKEELLSYGADIVVEDYHGFGSLILDLISG